KKRNRKPKKFFVFFLGFGLPPGFQSGNKLAKKKTNQRIRIFLFTFWAAALILKSRFFIALQTQ
ncbi:hypothetical protein B1150_09300, partial [Enterococcus faecium]